MFNVGYNGAESVSNKQKIVAWTTRLAGDYCFGSRTCVTQLLLLKSNLCHALIWKLMHSYGHQGLSGDCVRMTCEGYTVLPCASSSH